jgi:hypothetical protein
MRHLPLSAALAVTLLAGAPVLHAQPPSAQTAPAATCPSTATLDDLIKAIDAAVSGPASQDRTCFRALFLPDARLIPIRIAPDGTATPRILTVDDWISLVAKRGSAVLSEHQIKVKAETWDHMAHLWSTYETRVTPDGNPSNGKATEGQSMDRGINSIQAIFDGKQWHIIEITWQAQTPANPVPEKYLP